MNNIQSPGGKPASRRPGGSRDSESRPDRIVDDFVCQWKAQKSPMSRFLLPCAMKKMWFIQRVRVLAYLEGDSDPLFITTFSTSGFLCLKKICISIMIDKFNMRHILHCANV